MRFKRKTVLKKTTDSGVRRYEIHVVYVTATATWKVVAKYGLEDAGALPERVFYDDTDQAGALRCVERLVHKKRNEGFNLT